MAPTSKKKSSSAAKSKSKASKAKKKSAQNSPKQGTKRKQGTPDSTGRADGSLRDGGDRHQTAGAGVDTMTTAQGVPISDDQNTLTSGQRGPQLLEDFVMREKIFHFDHERIPERVVHARGYGAKGFFETYEPIPELTKADLFQRQGERTDLFVRFSTVAGSQGSPDLARDVRGFAVKFYTKAGNWDLVGNNMPVFFIQDAMKFPDLVHAAKPEPDKGFPQAQTAHDNFWDFASLMPESTHMLLWAMSDRAIPRSFRFMEGFGVHTFRFVNADGASSFVKFHWKPKQGLQSVTWDEAVKINGADPDFHRRDLWNAITAGDYPEWELGVQIFDDDYADSFPFDVLDATKFIPEEDVPVQVIGRMVLDTNVDNFFAETEQVAFCTSNVVPGIDFTNDPLLQGRNFSYLDTQLKRLGSPNFTHLPVNAPRCPVAHFQQDGHMAVANPTGRANYEPNSWGTDEGGPREEPDDGFSSYAEAISGDKRRVRPELFADHYSQARQFYRSQSSIEQLHIADAFAFELSKVHHVHIPQRIVGSLRHVDPTLAESVANKLGIELPDAPEPARPPIDDLSPSDALSILANGPTSFAGRKLGILVSDGADAAVIESLVNAATEQGVTVAFIASHRHGGIADSAGNAITVDEKIDGGPSVLFDAVALVVTEDGASQFAGIPATKQFISDAHNHAKFIAYSGAADELFNAAGIEEADRNLGYHRVDDADSAAEFIEACGALRCWQRVHEQ